MTALAGEGKEIFVIAVFALHPGKAVVQAAAIKVTVSDLLEIGRPSFLLSEENRPSMFERHKTLLAEEKGKR